MAFVVRGASFARGAASRDRASSRCQGPWPKKDSRKRRPSEQNATEKNLLDTHPPNRGMSSDPPLRLVIMSPAGSTCHAVVLCSARRVVYDTSNGRECPYGNKQAGALCGNGASRRGARDGPVQLMFLGKPERLPQASPQVAVP
jgi:hypothetical protein